MKITVSGAEHIDVMKNRGGIDLLEILGNLNMFNANIKFSKEKGLAVNIDEDIDGIVSSLGLDIEYEGIGEMIAAKEFFKNSVKKTTDSINRVREERMALSEHEREELNRLREKEAKEGAVEFLRKSRSQEDEWNQILLRQEEMRKIINEM